MIHRAIGITSVLAALASSTVASAPESPAIEDFYCEASYINFAHGYQHKGHYVDGRGRVFRFDTYSPGVRVEPWQPAEWGSPTQHELEAKFHHNRQQTGVIDGPQLSQVRHWLADARHGSLTKKVQQGADRGSEVSACWIREAGSEGYRRIELVVLGDFSYKNTSPAAADLDRWLRSTFAE